MRRRSFLRGLVAIPVAAVLAPLVPEPDRWPTTGLTNESFIAIDYEYINVSPVLASVTRGYFTSPFDIEMGDRLRELSRSFKREFIFGRDA